MNGERSFRWVDNRQGKNELHEIVRCKDLDLLGAELHRFNNPAGVAYSAIYEGNIELMSSERYGESAMVKYYLKMQGYK